MNQFTLKETIERIAQMERCFYALYTATQTNPTAIHQDPALKECLWMLQNYYEGGQWLCDYELDEQGKLPVDLKRGVLSQDGVFDLFEIINQSAQ